MAIRQDSDSSAHPELPDNSESKRFYAAALNRKTEDYTVSDLESDLNSIRGDLLEPGTYSLNKVVETLQDYRLDKTRPSKTPAISCDEIEGLLTAAAVNPHTQEVKGLILEDQDTKIELRENPKNNY